jgi:hypothetical protein
MTPETVTKLVSGYNASNLHSVAVHFEFRRTPTILSHISRGFSRALQEISRMLTAITPGLHSSTYS